MTIQAGEFWVADIPFTDGSGSKRRPVLVLWLDAMDVIAAVVTTAPPRSKTDVALSTGKRVDSGPPRRCASPAWTASNSRC